MISLDYLRRDNPRLLELEARYAALNLPFGHTQWKDHQRNLGIGDFRNDGAYLGQGALRGEPQYRAMYEHVKSIDRNAYLQFLTEDDAFGVHTYEYDGKIVSRDLLDSIMEMYFVEDSLGDLPNRWLDIGAGYGRFAHRLTQTSTMISVACVDAVPVSTFLCEFYRDYREMQEQVDVLPLDIMDTWIQPGQFDIACNIHSWSECSASAIEFWLGKLVEWKVPYLFIVPHDERWVCVNEDGSIGNFRPLLDKYGFNETHSQTKYPDGVDGLYPEVNYHLFRR